MPKSFQIVAKMVKNRGLEGVWGCFVACLRPKVLWVASWTALGQLLGGSWRILGACWVAPGPSWAAGWGVQGRLEGSLEASWGKLDAKMEPSWH